MTHSLRNVEAEQALLGAVMLSNDALDLVEQLSPGDFSEPVYGDMFQAMRTLVGAGRDVDAVVLATAMETDPRLAEWGGMRHLADLMRVGAPKPRVASYAKTIRELAARRIIHDQARHLADQAAGDMAISPEEIVAKAALALSKAVERCSEPARRRASTAFSVDQLHDRAIPPRQWHVREMIPSKTVTLLSGDGGAGKSTLALQLGVATAIGASWLGLETRRGRTLYLSAEDDEDELHRRLDAIALHHDATLSDLGDIKIWPLTDAGGALLADETARDRLQLTPLWDELCDVAREWRPCLIVLDSLADIYGGNEISRPQVRQFIAALRCLAAEVEAAIVVLAHPSVEGMRSGSGISGSTAWHNSVRSRLYLETSKSDGEWSDPTIKTLSSKKSNYGPPVAELRLQLVLGAFNNLNGAGRQTVDVAIRRAQAEELFLRLLDRFNGQGRSVSHMAGSNYAPAAFADCEEALGTSKAAFKQAMHRLFALKSIAVSETGPPSRRRFTIVRSDVE